MTVLKPKLVLGLIGMWEVVDGKLLQTLPHRRSIPYSQVDCVSKEQSGWIDGIAGGELYIGGDNND